MGGLTDAIESSGILDTVKGAAPLLGAVLGSPVAGVGLALLGNLFGVDSKDVKAIANAIQNDPEALIKIKTLEYQHAASLAQIAAQNYQTEVEDRKSAREREVSLRDYVPTILAVGFLLNYAMIQFYCVTHPSSAIDIISARFQDVLIMIMSYYFGSSHKSREGGK
jgi:hypothetical protein